MVLLFFQFFLLKKLKFLVSIVEFFVKLGLNFELQVAYRLL
jgi:hypothetical protein